MCYQGVLRLLSVDPSTVCVYVQYVPQIKVQISTNQRWYLKTPVRSGGGQADNTATVVVEAGRRVTLPQ